MTLMCLWGRGCLRVEIFPNHLLGHETRHLYLLYKFLEWNPVPWRCISRRQVGVWSSSDSRGKLGSYLYVLLGKGWKKWMGQELERALMRHFPISQVPRLDWENSVEGSCFLIPAPQNSAPQSFVTGNLPLRFSQLDTLATGGHRWGCCGTAPLGWQKDILRCGTRMFDIWASYLMAQWPLCQLKWKLCI